MDRYEALKHAVKAHAGQLDKCGQPYILHPIAVAEAVEGAETLAIENLVIVALLHDVLEDTDYRLPRQDLSTAQAAALDYLTRWTGATYEDYIDRLCEAIEPKGAKFELPLIVKLADLYHNLQPERQACLPEKERKSLEGRYLKARDRIWEALDYEWWPESEGNDRG